MVPKSKRPRFRGGPKTFLYEYHHGVLLGNRFWTFGKYGRNKNIFLEVANSGENLMSGSCHLDRALNDKFSVECLF